VAFAFAAIVLLGIAAVASGTNAGAGLKRAVGDLAFYGLHPVELVVPPARNILFGDSLTSFWSSHSHGSNQPEISNYLGLLTLALAITWLWVAFRRRATLSADARTVTGALVATFLVGLAFAAPSPIHVFGAEIPMPSRLLWEVVPAFRVPSRWDPLLMTALIPLAALGLQTIWRRLAGNGARIAVVAAAMVVSFGELTIHPAEPRFRTIPTPPEYGAVERTPVGVLAEYPLGSSDVFRFWQTRHERPLLNGAPPETPSDYVRRVVLDPAEPGTARSLSLLGVTAIAIHPNAHVDAEVAPREPSRAGGYRLVGRFADGAAVWQVTAPAAPALVTLPGGFAAPRRTEQGFIGYPLVSPAGVGVLELRAKESEVVQLVFDVVVPGGGTRSLRVADSQHEQQVDVTGRTRVSVNVMLPRGVSQLLVKTDPPSTSEADALVLSTPHAEAASGAAVLHADRISADPGF
jgi:hypothetical protein